MATWRLDPPHREPAGSGTDLTDLRAHGAAHCVLFWLAVGCTLEVRGGEVQMVDPDGNAGEEPVPLAVLDAVQAAGWVGEHAGGLAITAAGRWELDRWGRRRYTARSWAKAGAMFTGLVID